MARKRAAQNMNSSQTSRKTSASVRMGHGGNHNEWFSRFAHEMARLAGKPASFILAVLAILIWGATGPLFGYSDTWQLIINTSTTIITFVMV